MYPWDLAMYCDIQVIKIDSFTKGLSGYNMSIQGMLYGFYDSDSDIIKSFLFYPTGLSSLMPTLIQEEEI